MGKSKKVVSVVSKNISDKRDNLNIYFIFFEKYFIFNVNGKVKQQISETAIGTKCAPIYTCTYMDEFENEFHTLRNDKHLLWLILGILVTFSLDGHLKIKNSKTFTAWKVSKYGVFSDLYSVRMRKIRTRKNSVFRHFSRSEGI